MISVKPTISYEQYRVAYLAMAAAKQKAVQKPRWERGLPWVLVGLGLGIALQFEASRASAITTCFVLIVYCAIRKPLAKRSFERQLRAFYAEEQARLNDQVLTIDEAGISCVFGQGQATSFQRWGWFIKLLDLPDAFLFLTSPNGFVRVPKQGLAPSELQQILEWSLGTDPRLRR